MFSKFLVSGFLCASMLAVAIPVVRADESHTHHENMSAMPDGPLHIMGAWVRPTVKGQRATGAYMKVMAHADGKLVGAKSNLAERTEVHEMKMDGDIMRMRRVDAIKLEEGDMIKLEPGGYHVMFMGLNAPIEKDSEVHFSLVFEDADGKQTEVPVTAKASMQAGAGGGHDHSHHH